MSDRTRPAANGDRCERCGVIPWPGEPVHPTPHGPECSACHQFEDWIAPAPAGSFDEKADVADKVKLSPGWLERDGKIAKERAEKWRKLREKLSVKSAEK
jgi:hypothetical protein